MPFHLPIWLLLLVLLATVVEPLLTYSPLSVSESRLAPSYSAAGKLPAGGRASTCVLMLRPRKAEYWRPWNLHTRA